jgi:hypothetical protein
MKGDLRYIAFMRKMGLDPGINTPATRELK